MRLLVITLVFFAICGCNTVSTYFDKQPLISSDSIFARQAHKSTCDSVLSSLIHSSSLSDRAKQLNVESEITHDGNLNIRLYQVSGLKNKTTFVNLLIDPVKRTFSNTSLGTYNPKPLKYDTSILNYMIGHCMSK
ncbi:MAG: hypothetical protein P4L41_08380 [Flavipsychrobacter sp.]|nr:hypothetical protein [Flavipsychrobacter sp.]